MAKTTPAGTRYIQPVVLDYGGLDECPTIDIAASTGLTARLFEATATAIGKLKDSDGKPLDQADYEILMLPYSPDPQDHLLGKVYRKEGLRIAYGVYASMTVNSAIEEQGWKGKGIVVVGPLFKNGFTLDDLNDCDFRPITGDLMFYDFPKQLS